MIITKDKQKKSLECNICKDPTNYDNMSKLKAHLSREHSLSYKEYYHSALKLDSDGSCLNCGMAIDFKKNCYQACCSVKCAQLLLRGSTKKRMREQWKDPEYRSRRLKSARSSNRDTLNVTKGRLSKLAKESWGVKEIAEKRRENSIKVVRDTGSLLGVAYNSGLEREFLELLSGEEDVQRGSLTCDYLSASGRSLKFVPDFYLPALSISVEVTSSSIRKMRVKVLAFREKYPDKTLVVVTKQMIRNKPNIDELKDHLNTLVEHFEEVLS